MTRRHREGPLGRSIIERVHVRRSRDEGNLEPFDLVRVVDADEDPELAARALAGDLLRLPDGTELAEPFLYHTREGRMLALVIPSPARHRELDARRALLNQLDALESVPAYAFDFRVVLDAAGLRALLPERLPGVPPPLLQNVSDDELDELPSGPDAIGPELLSHLATDLVDDEEAAALEEVEDLDTEAVTDDVDDEDPREDTHLDGDPREDTHLDGVEEVEEVEDTHLDGDPREDTHLDGDPREDTHLDGDPREDTHLDGDRVEEGVEEAEDTHLTRPAASEAFDADLADDEVLLDDEPAAQPEVQSFLDDAPQYALVDADWVTAYQEDDDVDEALLLDESDLVVVPESYSTVVELGPVLPPPVAAPRDFATDPRRLRAGLFSGSVWLFAKTRPGVFEEQAIDAAVQFAQVGGRSIVLVALADLTADRTEAVRLAAELAAPAPRALLGALAKDFTLNVAFFHDGPAPVRCVQLRSSREQNVARLLARPTLPALDAVDTTTAIARALAAPPPLDSTEHPFQPRRTGGTAVELRAEIRNVARWLEPSRRDRVRQGMGVPEPVIHDVCEAVLREALAVGIALPPTLMQWGVSRDIATSPAEIVAQQLEAFLALTSEPERGGLRDADVASNWNALRGAAAAFAVPTPPAVEEVLRAMDTEGVARDPEALEGLNVAALLELTRHATHRRGSALELLRRDPQLHADAVGMALRDMRRDEVVVLVPALKRAGEAVVPMLLETLSAKKTFVRQAAALTLSALQAEEAVPGLVRLVAKENTTLWEEFARALAAFGEVALESVLEAVRADALPAERAALILAYLSKGGFASPVEDLAQDPDPKVSAVARGVPLRLPTVDRHLREFYDPTETPTGPREFGKKLYRALYPESVT